MSSSECANQGKRKQTEEQGERDMDAERPRKRQRVLEDGRKNTQRNVAKVGSLLDDEEEENRFKEHKHAKVLAYMHRRQAWPRLRETRSLAIDYQEGPSPASSRTNDRSRNLIEHFGNFKVYKHRTSGVRIVKPGQFRKLCTCLSRRLETESSTDAQAPEKQKEDSPRSRMSSSPSGGDACSNKDKVSAKLGRGELFGMFAGSRESYEKELVFASKRRRELRELRGSQGHIECAQEKEEEEKKKPQSVEEKLVQLKEKIRFAVKHGNKHLLKPALSSFLRFVWSYGNKFNDYFRAAVEHALHDTIVLPEALANVCSKLLLKYCTSIGIHYVLCPPCRCTPHASSGSALLEDAVRYSAYTLAENILTTFHGNPNRRTSTGCYCLMIATYKNDVRMMELLLRHGSLVNQIMDNGVSALAVAAYRGNLEALNLLLAHGASKDAQILDGTTPLIAAVQEGHSDIVDALLQAGAHVNLCKHNGSTPLIVAVRHRRQEMILSLGKAGADPNLSLSNGATAMVLACANGDLKSVKNLLSLNADVFAELHSGATALEYATHRGHHLIVMQILASLETKPSPSHLLRLEQIAGAKNHSALKKWLITYRTRELSPLHFAVSLGDVPEIRRIFQSSSCDTTSEKAFLEDLAHPHALPYVHRALQPFSKTNEDLWPTDFVSVVQHVSGSPTPLAVSEDVLLHIFSFCNRTWFN